MPFRLSKAQMLLLDNLPNPPDAPNATGNPSGHAGQTLN